MAVRRVPLPLAPAAAPEDITADKWYQQGARQPRALPIAAGIIASGFAWSGFTPAPPAETITVDKWLPTQTQPTREPPRPRGALAFTAPAPDFVTADRWLPYQTRPAVEARAPRSAGTAPPELTFFHGWRAPQSRPAYTPATRRDGLAWAPFVEAAPEVVTVDKWWSHPAQPARDAWRPPVAPVWVAIVAQVETVTPDKWLPQPARPHYRQFFSGWHQATADPPWDTSPPGPGAATDWYIRTRRRRG